MKAQELPPTKEVKDFLEDSGLMFSRIFSTAQGTPSMLKGAGHEMDPHVIGTLPLHSFAEPESRKFLLHDPSHALVSFAYLKAAGISDADPRMERTRKAAFFFGIEDEIKSLEDVIARRISEDREKARANTKQAALKSPSEEWAVSAHVRGYGTFDIFGASSEDLERAIRKVASREFSMQHPPEVVMSVASCLASVAEKEHMSIKTADLESMRLLSGDALPNREHLEAYLSARAVALPMEKRAEFLRVTRKLASAGDMSPDLNSLVLSVGRFDRDNNIVHMYGDRFPDPIRTVYHITRKAASDAVERITLAGKPFRRCDLETAEGRQASKLAFLACDLDPIPDGDFSAEALRLRFSPELEQPFLKMASRLGIVPVE
jgi:hypothetical protein